MSGIAKYNETYYELPRQSAQSGLIPSASYRQDKSSISAKQDLTRTAMSKQLEIVHETLQRNTRDLNESLCKFITEKNFTGILDSQVPTSLIMTSSESASSIETQFEQLTSELQQRCKAKCLMLDEKKCTTTKNAIDHIITRLMNSFGVHNAKKNYRLSDLESAQDK